MPKAKIKISTKPGKSGAKIASGTIRIGKTDGRARVTGKPMLQTRAQLNVHIQTKNGRQRASSR